MREREKEKQRKKTEKKEKDFERISVRELKERRAYLCVRERKKEREIERNKEFLSLFLSKKTE